MKDQNNVLAGPTPPESRMLSLDLLRGFSFLGILLVDVQLFAMPKAASLNPLAYGDFTGMNRWIWMVTHIVADQKFLNLFALLFGAGIIIFTERLEKENAGVMAVYFRKLFWLLMLGLLHAYLLWPGDMLTAFAVSGALVFFLRKWKIRGLITLGLVFLAVPAFNYWLFGASVRHWPPEAVRSLLHTWKPDAAATGKEITAMTGNLVQQLAWRAQAAWKMQTYEFTFLTGWQVSGMMVIGMGLYKWGIMTAKKGVGFYITMGLAGLIAGLYLVTEGIVRNFKAGWSVEYSMFFGWEWNYIGSFFLSLFYLSVIMLWVRSGLLRMVQNMIVATGRMSLTNYLLTSVMGAILFYGLGWYGKTERVSQMIMVLVLWVAWSAFSVLWLKHYRYGPLEWLWRSLTYRKWLANKK